MCWLGLTEPVWTRWQREKNSFPWRESNPGRPARTLLTKLNELPRLKLVKNDSKIYSAKDNNRLNSTYSKQSRLV
jgi:hypothetical protein